MPVLGEPEVERRSLFRNPYVWGFLVGIATLTALRPLMRYIPDPPPVLSRLPAFSLVGPDGLPFGSDDLRGQVYVANLFAANGASPELAAMKGMSRLQDAFAQRDIRGIRLVSISVDPEQDTPAALGAYAKRVGADPRRWTLLTGDRESIRALVVDGFKIPSAPRPAVKPEPRDLALAGKLVLVDGEGRIRGYYASDEMGLDEVYNRAQRVVAQEHGR